jgi:hypothetical protein
MLNFYKRLTGIHLKSGGFLDAVVEKVNKLPWWRSKTIFLHGDNYYSPCKNLTIPSNVTLYVDKGCILGSGFDDNFTIEVANGMKEQDWFIETRRLDIVVLWMEASEGLVNEYIKHMNLVYDSISFGNPVTEPYKFTGLAGRYKNKEAINEIN